MSTDTSVPLIFTQLKLKKGADRRFQSGHPWVYANEVEGFPKAMAPGSLIRLCEASGKALAWGYGNPRSLILFRELSREENAVPVTQNDLWKFIYQSLKSAYEHRMRLGYRNVSFRWVFGESDSLPGLVIDLYRVSREKGTEPSTVIVVQAHTAGVDRWIDFLPEVICRVLAGFDVRVNDVTVIVRNDMAVRELEGLELRPAQIVLQSKEQTQKFSLENAQIILSSVNSDEPIFFKCDLLKGQKTGFFLDQVGNTHSAFERLKPVFEAGKMSGAPREQPLKLLDLCCYVGQWSAQWSKALIKAKRKTEVTLVDASEAALTFARQNVEAQGARVETLKADVMTGLKDLPGASYDIVICDPPGLIKSKRDIEKGLHAYLTLNTQALRLVKSGGVIVTSSCSGQLSEEEFLATVAKAARRSKRNVKWIYRGGPASDHPMKIEFPEGHYLKCWVGLVGEVK